MAEYKQGSQFAVPCADCQCNTCKYSCELRAEYCDELSDEECQTKLCFNCDECREWRNDSTKLRKQRMCSKYVESENSILYRAEQRRKHFRIIKQRKW